MNRPLFALTMVCACCFSLVAQEKGYAIKGTVMDTVSNVQLAQASIVLVHARDSMLYRFTRTDANGNFLLDSLVTGEYMLFATYPEYADYVERFTVDSTTSTIDFGSLGLVLRAKLLEEVLVNRSQPITIRGDTTEYDAASFTIQPNSKVEDLLKQLPGIQVDQDGKITAQGQAVNKVLVDGEEFFGDDPTLVTRNLRGDMVDKVQLYDKRSDQAEFTGIDDGERTKTLNITLKDDKKKGYFGKADAGVGTNDMYQGQAMFNRFNDKQRFSVYGTVGNTGRTGLGWEDNQRYAGSNNVSLTDGGGIMVTGGSGDELESFNGHYDGRGIPSALTGGAHYSNKWNDGKHSINGNYKIGELGVRGSSNTITQNNLPTGAINTVSDQSFDNRLFRQKAGAIYEAQFDSTSTLKVTVEGTLRNAQTDNDYQSQATDAGGGLLNRSMRQVTNDTDGRQANISALWTKKLRKAGRTLSWDLNESIDQSRSRGFLYAENSFYDRTGTIDSVAVVDQLKVNDRINSVFNSNFTYSEPFTEALSLVLNYRFTASSGTSLRQSFNPVGVDNYTDLDSLFSNDFKLNQLANQLGAIFNYKKGKSTLNFGTRISRVQFNQTDRYTDNRFERRFTNYNPQARWQYRFSQQKSFNISYNGSNTQPSIDQIQPIRVNDDPLNIVLGNPDLKPSFTNRLNAQYHSYKVLSNQYFYVFGNYSTTHNPIVSNTVTDSLGRNTFRYDNLQGRSPSNFSVATYLGTKLKKWDINVGGGLNANGNVYYNLTNNELNRTVSSTYSGSLNIRQHKQKKYDFYIDFGPSYTTGASSLQQQQNNNGWGLQGGYGFTIYLPKKFQLTSDGRYTYTAATQSFDEDFEQFIVNAAVSKKFLKDETLNFSVGVNDIFKHNVGFSRFANNNIFTQNRYTTITRYLLFSLTWDFNKMGGF